jgi:excisionase family DNA binding protein
MNNITETSDARGAAIAMTDADALAEIRESQDRLSAQVRRLHELLERQGALLDIAYLSIKGTAQITALSDSHIRQAVTCGELPASNVGTARRPIYRIAKTDLSEWLESRKGISRPLGRAELRALIERQMPGLSGTRSK